LHDESIYYVSPPAVTNPPTLHVDLRISRLPFIRNTDDTSLVVTNHPIGHPPRLSTRPYSDANSGMNDTSFKSEGIGNGIRTIPRIIRDDEVETRNAPIRVSPIHYVEHPVAFVPTPTTSVIYAPESQTTPPSSPLDVTMLAIMGLTLAGAGMMKTQTAVAKQNEQATQQAQALAQLQAQQSAQKQTAQANWAENQAMQASAKQAVVTQVTQSQANIEFMDSHNRWYRESTIKNLLIQLQQSVTLSNLRYVIIKTAPIPPPPLSSPSGERGENRF